MRPWNGSFLNLNLSVALNPFLRRWIKNKRKINPERCGREQEETERTEAEVVFAADNCQSIPITIQ